MLHTGVCMAPVPLLGLSFETSVLVDCTSDALATAWSPVLPPPFLPFFVGRKGICGQKSAFPKCWPREPGGETQTKDMSSNPVLSRVGQLGLLASTTSCLFPLVPCSKHTVVPRLLRV